MTEMRVLCLLIVAMVFCGAACRDEDAGAAGGTSPNNVQMQGLTVTSPTPEQIFTTLDVLVEGTAVDLDEVLVNGNTVEVVDGAFSTTLRQAEGRRVITVKGGSDEVEVPIAIDINLPELTIETPEHGQFVTGDDGDQIFVSGRAFDSGAGLDRVEVDGFPIPVDAEGKFGADVPLKVGANLMEIVAFDKADRSTSALRAAVYGDFVPWGEPMNDALVGHMTPEILDVIEVAVVNYIGSGIVDELLAGVLPQDEDESFQVERFEYGEVTFELTMEQGYIGMVGKLHGLTVDVTFADELSVVGDVDIAGGIDIELAEIVTEIVPSIGGNGVPAFEQRNTLVTLEGFNLRGDGLLDIVFTIMEEFAREKAEEALVDLVEDFVVPQIFDPALLRQEFVLLDTSLIVDITLQQLSVTPEGIDLTGQIDMPIGPGLGVPDSPGVLTTPGRPPQDPPERMLRMAGSDDMFNKMLFTAWRAGTLNLEVRDLLGEGGSLPVLLDAGSFALLFGDELLEHADRDTPIDVELRPLLPPVADIRSDSEHPLGARIGDLKVDLYFSPESGERTRWATIMVAMDMSVTVRLVEGELDFGLESEAWADLIDEPLFELDDEAVELMIAGLFQNLPGILGPRGLNGLFTLSDVDVLGIRIEEGEVSASGTSNNFLSIEADLAVESTDEEE